MILFSNKLKAIRGSESKLWEFITHILFQLARLRRWFRPPDLLVPSSFILCQWKKSPKSLPTTLVWFAVMSLFKSMIDWNKSFWVDFDFIPEILKIKLKVSENFDQQTMLQRLRDTHVKFSFNLFNHNSFVWIIMSFQLCRISFWQTVNKI